MDIVNGLNDAVQLLQEQEDQGVAADRTQDLFMTAVMHDSKLYDAVLAYFTSQKDANPNTETYTSLIYVCVKLRQLDEGFKQFERMMNEGVLPDNRTYAHLIKGCGRTKQIKRGEAFWRLLKQRNAPQVYDRRVFNAMINMYSHSKQRHQFLTPAEAAPPWEIFGEMQNRGVEPDDVTYNSLISLCSRTLKPDIVRALSTLREMSAVGVPPSDVTLCALTQSLGRANNIELARSQIKELLASQPQLRPTTSTWRPLLHATAVSGDVEMTQTLFDEMKAACGSVLFDSFKHRVSHATNYLILAHGYKHGYAAAEKRFAEARSSAQVDMLTYTFMLELALGLHSRPGRSPLVNETGRTLALGLWDMMRADGLTPSSQFCHRLFAVYAQHGRLEEAEALFGSMQAASQTMRRSGEDLAARWAGGDLESVRAFLATASLSGNSMCHTSHSYVRLIEACVMANQPQRAALHLKALQEEAQAKGIFLGHELTTPLLLALSRGGLETLDLALELHQRSFEGGRPCAAAPSIQLCGALLKQRREHAAATTLLQMALPRRDQQWVYSKLEQRLAKLHELTASSQPPERRPELEALLDTVCERFELQPPAEKAAAEQVPAAAPAAS